MLTILLGMAAIILAGTLWRVILGSKSADTIRSHMAKAVYDVFLPALVLHVMWQTPLTLNTLRIPTVSIIAILLSLLLGVVIYGNGRLIRAFMGDHGARRGIGAILLACAFGNFTYLGLPVLTQTFGPWSQMIAIHFDLLASTPLLFTIGIMLAGHYGQSGKTMKPLLELLKVPALWAVIGGIFLSASGVPMPGWLDETLGILGSAVVPLMLLSVGMALRWQSGWLGRIPVLLPMIIIQLALMPAIVWVACIGVGMPAKLVAPSVIEGAMPSMVLGLVICDRFKLDASLYAEAVTVTTALSLLTLPVWLGLVS
ncbi:MAG: AEC family transporter [Mariprofundaceae bacterium]